MARPASSRTRTAPAGAIGGPFAYPEATENPIPHGGTTADWIEWGNRLSVIEHFGGRCTQFETGAVSFVFDSSPLRLNPNGSVHGGVIAAIADDAFGAVFLSVVDPGFLPATASLTVDYVRPAFLPLVFDARVTSQGRSLIHCETLVTGPDGKPSNRCRAIMAVKAAQ